MIKQILLEEFNKHITNLMKTKGERVLKNDLIKDININVEDDSINIKSYVVSESLYSEYSCNLEIDNITRELIGTHCSCADFEKNEFRKDNYCCKHITATFYSFLKSIDNDSELRKKLSKSLENKSENSTSRDSSLSLLSLLIDDKEKDLLKFDIIINKNNWSSKLQAEFKVGIRKKSSKMYIIRDINQFLLCSYNNVPIKYGKDFEFDLRRQRLSLEDKRLFKFMNNIRSIAENDRSFRRSQDKLIDGKIITIPDYMVKEFLRIIKKNRVYLGDGFFYRVLESEILEEDIPIPLSLDTKKDSVTLEANNGMPEALTKDEDVFLYGTSIYIPSLEQCERLEPYLKIFGATSKISFPKDKETKILTDLIPSIQKVTDGLILSKSIKNKVVISKPKFNFYFDKDKEISLTFKVSYAGHEFNYFEEYKDKVIYRDTTK